ncbi:MAG: aminotransferase class V-fold PLP-dependent enzyme [Chloroflexota bacterium]|nr:aminotransferase class V-fold PLP-dependent enzyme [Chloroflexota bacterium]
MIYMDNAATSWPKPEAVYQAMDIFMRNSGANPGRSGHRLSVEAGRVIYEAREALAQLFSIDDPLRVVFAKNATEALNLAINGILHPGDHAITSSMEHNSVMRPLRALQEKGIEITVIGCSAEGFLDPQEIEKAIKPNTRLIVLTHASNVVGTLLPVAEVGAIARRHGALFCIDASQTAGACPIDMGSMNIDLLAFTGHKSLFGPQGTGGLCLGKGIREALEPLMRGGTGSRSESEHQPDFLPDRFESGTPNTVGLAGLGAGVNFVLSQGIEELMGRKEKLTALLIQGLGSIPGVTIYGSGDARKQMAVVSFNIEGAFASEVAMSLDENSDIMCRSGLQCAPIAHRTLGTFPEGTARLSPGFFNTEEEVEIAVQAIRQIAEEARGN